MRVDIGAALVAIGLLGMPPSARGETPPARDGSYRSTITGKVVDRTTGASVSDAIVILQCSCLSGMRETKTDTSGLYAFRDLGPGRYTVQVLFGQADVSKVLDLGQGMRHRANFQLEPKDEFRREVVVAATTSKDAVGISLAGTTASWGFSGRARRAERRSRSTAGATPARPIPEPTAAPPPDVPELEADPAVTPDLDELPHQIIYTGSMRVAVFHLEEARGKAETLVTEVGGYVQAMNDGGMTLRIPADRFRDTMDRLGELGRVEARAIESADVTEDFYDLETRIAVLRQTQSRLMSLLARAQSVEETLKVQTALDRVTLDLEAALGRQRALESQIRYSRLNVELVETIPDARVPTDTDPFPWVDSIGVEVTQWR